MESSFSAFPIIIEGQPGQGRRRASQDSFIRAHVMERYHRQRKFGGSKGMKTNPLPDASLPGDITFVQNPMATAPGRKKRSPNSVKEASTKNTTPKRKLIAKRTVSEPSSSVIVTTPLLIDLELSDPRIRESPMFMEVFKAYFGMLEARQTPLDRLSRIWLPEAFSDLALFHAILFNFSQHLYALCSMDHEKPGLITHKVGALHQISMRMESQLLGCSDTVIASILCLISHELLNHDNTALEVHVRGLRQIIGIRGGVERLGLHGTVKTVYLSDELLLATVLKSWIPTLPILTDFANHCSCSNTYPRPWNILTLTRLRAETSIHSFDDKIVGTLHRLERIFSHPVKVDRPSYLAEFLVDLDDSKTLSHDNYTHNDEILFSLRLAILLYYGISDRFVAHRLVEQLKTHLNESFIESFWSPFPGALLFCLVIGLRTSKNTRYRPWFMANLIRVTTGLAFETWEGLKECLFRFRELEIVD
ncbi:hypothetical protein F5884DRAFT_348749 [Xylogone sp. PMI_703]|nr:hypothetical protein F5884DRAFT_348749 [Xylogone sp. PMI_703]